MSLVPIQKVAIPNMPEDNYRRMLALIDEVFELRNDQQQLQVTRKQQKKLQALHPATLTEVANDAGPLIWCLIWPTTRALMQQFVAKEITETQLLELTPSAGAYQALYLCSITALPEARGMGQSFKLAMTAITAIRQQHPISDLFVWPFTEQGNALSEKLAQAVKLPLLRRPVNV